MLHCSSHIKEAAWPRVITNLWNWGKKINYTSWRHPLIKKDSHHSKTLARFKPLSLSISTDLIIVWKKLKLLILKQQVDTLLSFVSLLRWARVVRLLFYHLHLERLDFPSGFVCFIPLLANCLKNVQTMNKCQWLKHIVRAKISSSL